MTAEKPITGCVGRGNWMPLMTALVAGGVTSPAPEGGPELGPVARASAGRTARPARVGGPLVEPTPRWATPPYRGEAAQDSGQE